MVARLESAAHAIRGDGTRETAADEEVDRASTPGHLVQPAETYQARLSQTPRDDALLLFRIVIAHGRGNHVVRHLSPPQLLLDCAARQRMVEHAVLDPQPRKDAIVDPPEVSRRAERGVDVLTGEAGLL